MPRPALLPLFVLLCACTASAAGSRSSSSGGRDCFLATEVDGFTDATDKSLVFTVSPRRYYRAETFGTCHDIDLREVVGLKSTGGSPWICSDLDAQVIVPSQIGPQRCFVRNLHRLSQAEVDELRGRKRDQP